MDTLWRSGMVSVTYRQLACEEIIALTAAAGLDGIEWGGDVHVPHGDVQMARLVRQQTQDAGLAVLSYGSYYRVGEYDDPGAEFAGVLQTAKALGAPSIRIWAGTKNAEDVDADTYARMVREVQAHALAAAAEGLAINFEYHGNTLTNTAPAAIRLMEDIGRDNVRLYWQPNHRERAQDAQALRQVLPYLTNVHVFWWGDARMYLAQGEDAWLEYMSIIRADGKPHDFMLEFVVDDAPENLAVEAQTLKRCMAAAGGGNA